MSVLGRPAKLESPVRIQITLETAERNRVSNKALEMGLSLSEYIRSQLKAATREDGEIIKLEKDAERVKTLERELSEARAKIKKLEDKTERKSRMWWLDNKPTAKTEEIPE